MKNKLFALSFAIMLFAPYISLAQTAVTAWERIGIMIAPSKTSTQIAAIRFGVDPVTLTDEKIQVQEDRKRTYVKVVLPDGTMGWVNEYLMIPNGEGALIRQTTDVFQNPVDGITMVRGVAFEAGEPVVKSEFNGAYAFVYGRDRKKSGWVRVESLIFDAREIRTALLLQKAKEEKNIAKRIEKLDEIRNQSDFSSFEIAYLVNNELSEAQSLFASGTTTIADNRDVVMTTATPTKPMRGGDFSTAKTWSERVIKPGDALENVLVVGDKVYSRNEQKLSLIQVTDPTRSNSTAFTCYHKSLPIGSKIQMFFPDNPGFIELEVIGNLKQNDGLGFAAGTIKRLFGDQIPESVNIQYFTEVK